MDVIIENVSNKYRLGLAVLHARETGTQRTFGDIAAHISWTAREPVIQA